MHRCALALARVKQPSGIASDARSRGRAKQAEQAEQQTLAGVTIASRCTKKHRVARRIRYQHQQLASLRPRAAVHRIGGGLHVGGSDANGDRHCSLHPRTVMTRESG